MRMDTASSRRSTGWSLALGATAVVALLALTACTTPRTPSGVQAVSGFDVDRYMGDWYEAARFENFFERGLIHTTAHYSRNADGSVKVINRGYDPLRKAWKEAEGTARVVGDPTKAALKVSFFGPFYGGYNVVALDENYQWAMVVGSSKDYLWILSRTPQLPWHAREHLMERARTMGLDVSKILWMPPTDDTLRPPSGAM